MDIHLSGCTQVLLLIYNKQLIVANVGDSRGIIATSEETDPLKNKEEIR